MLEVVRYACNEWVITPTSLAANEAAPSDVAAQSFTLVVSGVGVFTYSGEPDASGWWTHNSIHIRPDVDPALEHAISRYAIPTPPGVPGNQYTRHFQVEQIASFAGLASIDGKPDDLVGEVGFACDAWRSHPFDTMTDAFTSAQLPRLFTGIDADLAAWRGSQ